MCNSNFVKIENSRPVAKAGGRGEGGGLSICPTQISSFCPEQNTCLFWCYALNCGPEEPFVSSYFYAERGYFSFHKKAHLAATFTKKPVSSHFSTDIKTLNIVETLNWVSFDATVSLDFPCHGSKHVLPTESKPIVLSICNPFYNHKPVTDQSTTKRL